MPKVAKELTAQGVRSLSKPGFYSVGGVPGLSLRVTDSGAKYWVLRLCDEGRRRDLGVGSYPSISLSEARAKARERRLKGAVVDRIEAKPEKRAAKRIMTFKQAALTYIETYRSS